MIVTNDSKQDVTIGGEMAVQAFTIKASAKAFNILSANLYSNKLGAMVRELSTNADDAHKMAGKADVPFLITLPNSFEPSFKIRDYGTGLSEDQVMNIYTTFFESTKTESNDVVGCLGLGSKSPFGVADSFTITSFYNGERTVYSAFLDASGIPSIATFFKEETTEDNGVEIEVAIKANDFSTFAREVNRQLRYFKLKPNVIGNSNFVWDAEETYLYEGTNWKMISRGDSAKVVQGQISYPIDTSAMGSKFQDADRAIRDIFRMAIVFEVPIGQVNIAPSREALTYDDATIDNLLKSAEIILSELPGIITEAIKEADTEWNARLLFDDILKSISNSSYVRDTILEQNILWNGVDVSGLDLKFVENKFESIHGFSYTWRGNRFKKENRSPYAVYDSSQSKYSDDKFWNIQVRPQKDVTIYHAEPKAKALDGRIKQHMSDNSFRGTVHIITTYMTITELETALGGVKVIDSSKLDKVRREPVTKKDKKIITLQRYTHSWNKTDCWEDYAIEEEDVKDLKGFCVTLDRFDVVYNDVKYDSFREFVNSARELEIIDKNVRIYGIRAANKNVLHPLDCFFEHSQKAIEKKTTNIRYSFGDNSDRFSSMFTRNERKAGELLEYVSVDSPMHTVLSAIVHNLKFRMNWATEKFIKILNAQLPTIDISEIADLAAHRYSMMPKEIDYNFNVEVTAKYIVQMDMLHSLTYGNNTSPLEALITQEA